MKYSIMIRIISLIYFGNAIVEGCLKKQTGSFSMFPDGQSKLFREKLKECYKTPYYTDTLNLDGTIDFFVLHSRWVKSLTEVDAACDTDKTATCWKEELKDVIPEYTTLHSILANCFDSIQTEIGEDPIPHRVRREITMESKVRSRRSPPSPVSPVSPVSPSPSPPLPDNSKMFTCPELTAVDFKTKIEESSLQAFDFINTDDSFAGIQSVAEAFITYIRCPRVSCDLLATDAYNVNDQTGCNYCWYTRLAALVAADSAYRPTLLDIAYRQHQASNIVCVPTATITVNHDEINEMEIALNTSAIETELYLGKHPTCSDGYRIPPEDPEDSDCFADASIGYDSQKLGKFVLSGNKREKCQREVTVANGTLKFTYVVTKVPTINQNIDITRYSCASKTFVCELPISQVVDITPHPITPTIKHITSDNTTGTSHYRLSFALTGGDSSIEVGSSIAATITLENVLDSSTYKLVAGKCWATPTDNHDYETAIIKYDLIDCFGCPADATDDAFTLTTNRESNKVVFSVKSFTWTSIDKDSQLIYIHCEVRVYDDTTLTDHGYTAVDCASKPRICPTSRFRRGINMEESHLLSFGPITPFHKRQGQMLD